jgi:hypothetical protein
MDPDGSGRIRTSPEPSAGRVAITDSVRVSVEQIESMHTSAKDLLIADLKVLRQEAGHPSLGELVQWGQRKFSKSALDDHLSGRRTAIPNWRITSAYVQACHEFAKSTGLDIARLGSLEEWRVRWQAAKRGDRIAASPVRDLRSVATYTILDGKQQESDEILVSNFGAAVVGKRSGDTTVQATAVLERLRTDLLRLGESLSLDTGLLVITNGPIIGTRFALADDLVEIGRAPENDIILDDATVSRRHAVVLRHSNSFAVMDVGSRNGTFLDSVRITGETRLSTSQQLQIGVFKMFFAQRAMP